MQHPLVVQFIMTTWKWSEISDSQEDSFVYCIQRLVLFTLCPSLLRSYLLQCHITVQILSAAPSSQCSIAHCDEGPSLEELSSSLFLENV